MRASSSESVGSLAFTYKNCKYKLRDNTDGDVANTVCDFREVGMILVDSEIDLINIALFEDIL